MKKEDNNLIDVENVETNVTYFNKCAFFAALASFLLHYCLIHLSLASLAFYATYFTFPSGVFIVLSVSTTSACRLEFVFCCLEVIDGCDAELPEIDFRWAMLDDH